jgi:hypothetical protein
MATTAVLRPMTAAETEPLRSRYSFEELHSSDYLQCPTSLFAPGPGHTERGFGAGNGVGSPFCVFMTCVGAVRVRREIRRLEASVSTTP